MHIPVSLKIGIAWLLILLTYSVSWAVETEVDPLTKEQLRFFTEVYTRMKSDYVKPLDDNVMMQQCVRGMVNGIDPHSAYLDDAELSELKAPKKPIGGIGLELTMRDGYPVIVSSIEDTPSRKAGLISGDVIMQIDHTQMLGKTLSDTVKRLRGQPGTPVSLRVARVGQNQPLDIRVTRAEIKIHSVKWSLAGDGLGYIRISQFQSNTGQQFKDAIKKLADQNKGPLKGLVLDLRSNPGGLLNAAIAVADSLLNGGLIVYTEGRSADAEMKFTANGTDLLAGAPMAVLVDNGSAAASEVLAGALQDHKRAKILGGKTFGRASIQTIIPLANGGALKLTTANWRTPNGRLIEGTGIEPDMVLAGNESLPISMSDSVAIRALSELRRPSGDGQ